MPVAKGVEGGGGCHRGGGNVRRPRFTDLQAGGGWVRARKQGGDY